MSEPKCISPLLDGFAIGKLMSSHDGVRCYPALKENSDNKYIVKIISVPASQVQLDALLLTGAYTDPASAMDYFKELSNGVIKEAQTLRKLSKLEGYLPYEGWQVSPMDNNQLGYEIYLLGSYKRTLEKYMRRSPMTHLGAINLGLDMCAALAIARRSGKIYVDLKPSNIYISEEREYRIGDLGFMELDSLQYTSLPTKYQSKYTAPELKDPMATLNETVDTYSLGAILYEIYNNGTLGTPDEETGAYPSPANADYELAEIIQKAMAPDPKDRWSEPYEMGQALVAYMQRNSVNDVPIVPPVIAAPESEKPAEAEVPVPVPDLSIGESLSNSVDETDAAGESMPELIVGDAAADDARDLSVEAEALPETVEQNDSLTPDLRLQGVFEQAAPTEPQIKLDSDFSFDTEAASGDNGELISMDEETPEEYDDPIMEMKALLEKSSAEQSQNQDVHLRSHSKRGWIIPIVTVLIVSLLAACGYYFYKSYYIKTIDGLKVDGIENRMAVILDTDVDESLLTVVCTDTYGNTKKMPVSDGKAVFTDLLPDTQYKIRVEISGFHKLEGSTSHSYNTVAQTSVSDFQAVTGSEDGSAVLTFTVTGPETNEWIVRYSTEGEEEKTQSFTGHMITIPGLTIGKRYAFTLEPAAKLYVVGETTLDFTASRIVVAENLTVTSCVDGQITAQWNAPADTVIESWSVRCYSDDGYDQTVLCTEPTVTFDQIDPMTAYTIEVTAAGMTQPARTNVSANVVNLSDITVDSSDPSCLKVSWQFDGTAPETGWLIMYRIDGSEVQEVVQCDDASGVIRPRIPGAGYEITIQAADGRSVFGNTLSYVCPNAAIFVSQENAFTEEKTQKIQANMLVTPFKNWSYKDVTRGYYTSTFKVGQPISVLLYSPRNFYVNNGNVSILYVIRNSEGKVMTELIGQETKDWRAMWVNTDYHFCELDLPFVPSEPGEYTLYLYFNNGAVTSLTFTIKE